VQDSHEPAGPFVTCSNLLAERPPGLFVTGSDFLAERPSRFFVAGARLGSRCRKLTPHFVAKQHDLRFESGHSLWQLLEDLDPSFQSIHTRRRR
jgi:hypothetical protein